ATPQIDAFRAGEHGVQQQGRDKSRIAHCRRVVPNLQIGSGTLFADGETTVARLPGLRGSDSLGYRSGGNAAEVMVNPFQRAFRLDVANENERGVVRDVV